MTCLKTLNITLFSLLILLLAFQMLTPVAAMAAPGMNCNIANMADIMCMTSNGVMVAY